MGGTSPSTGMWQGEVFAISDCLVVIVCAAPSHLRTMWQGEVFAISDCLVVIVCAAPSHLQSVLHRSPVRWHLQLPLEATTQPQWRSSEHAWLTSARSCPEWYPLIGPGVPFPAPITWIWVFWVFWRATASR